MSAAGEGTIVAPTKHAAIYIKDEAAIMGLAIPEPISWNQLVHSDIVRKGPYLLDELGGILMGLGVKVATIDEDCNIEHLPSNPIHYGD